jgi:SsrA-binding protein
MKTNTIFITSGIMAVMSTSKKKPVNPGAILNRRARFDYELGEEIVAGLVLTGAEVRAARDGHVQLKGSYVSLQKGELWLTNASFSLKLNQRGVVGARTVDTSPKKLLASRKQIDSLSEKKKTGMSIIPTKLLTQGNFIKLVIALGKGKRKYDKRQALKKRDLERENRSM